MNEPVFAIVLAGGEGKRLMPLTLDRAKPAVPFGGNYRLVDFALSNLVNAGYYRIAVLTQYKSHSLDRHIATTWRLSPLLGNYVATVPAQMRYGRRWFAGSADAIFQNLNLIYDEKPHTIIVCGADHVYRMDPRQMVDVHRASGAAVTVAGLHVPVDQSSNFGIIEPGPDGRTIARFVEKPSRARGLPDAPGEALASMGIYVFSADALIEAVTLDASDDVSKHDVGGDLIPALVERGVACVYDFNANIIPGSTEDVHAYWRDVGTIDAYFDASMDLLSPTPAFDLANHRWPILTWNNPLPPARFITVEGYEGTAREALVCAGVEVAGGTVRRSVLSPGVRIGPGAVVEDSVLFNDVNVAAGAVVRRAIVDKNVLVPEGARLGVDLDVDRSRFIISPDGIVVVGKAQKVS